MTENLTYQVNYFQDGTQTPPNDNLPDFYTFGTITPTSETTEFGAKELPTARNLTVEVIRPDGTPVQNATVNVHQHHNGETVHTAVKTDSDGVITLDAADGETGIYIEPPTNSDLAENGTHFTLSGDTTKTLVLQPVVTVSGQVTTPNATAAANWQVVGHTDSGTTSDHNLTDQEGRFALSLAENTSYELGFRQYNPETNAAYPKDGIPDLALLQRYTTTTTDADLGTYQLPTGHQFNITVLEPDGTPATGLQVFVTRVKPDADLSVGTGATTNTDGQVVLNGASTPGVEVNGTLRVHISAPEDATYADTTKEFTVSSDGNATLQLASEMEINGTVLTPNGTAAAEERIEVDGFNGGGHGATHTTANGSFNVSVASGGDYHVGFTQVAGPDQYTATFPQDGVPDLYAIETVYNESDAALGTVSLPTPHNLTVNVVDSSGNPISNADVNLGSQANGARHWASGTTNANGTLTAEVVGPLIIHVQPPTDGYVSTGTELTVTNDTTVTLTLQNATTVTGQVRDSNGDTVASRYVGLWGGPGSDSNITSTTGNFSLTVAQNESYGLVFQDISEYGADDYQLNGRPDVYVAQEVTTSTSTANLGEVPLPNAHRLNVTVRDADGNPIPDAQVHVEHDIGSYQISLEGGTDATGRLVVNGHYGAEVNGSIQIHVEPPAGTDLKRNSTHLDVSSDRNVTVTLAQSVPVTGQVEYADGTPVAGYTMELQGQGGDNQLTDREGNFELDVKPNQTYTLGFKQTDWDGGKPNFPKDGRPDLHAFEAYSVGSTPESVGDLTLPPAHLVNITVVNESGVPVPNAQVDLNMVAEQGAAWQHHPGTTNANGEVVLDGANTPGIEANGTLSLRVRATSEYAQNATKIQVTERRNVTVVVRERVNISTRFVTETGTPMNGSAGYASDGYNYVVAELGADGNATLGVGANTTYTVGVFQHADGLSSYFAPRDNVSDLYEAATVDLGTADQDIGTQTVPNASGVLDVRVVNELGQPVEDARVTVFPAQQGNGTTLGWVETTNASGYFISNSIGTHGVEVTGNNTVRVSPPADSQQYVDKEYLRNVTVTNDTLVTVTLESTEPVVTGHVVDASGKPITDNVTAVNFSRHIFKTTPLTDGNFSTFLANGSYRFYVTKLPTGDGTVDSWMVEHTVSGDTDIGTMHLPRGYNVTLNATEPDGTQADTRIAVLGPKEGWIYEYATGRLLDDQFVRLDETVQTRELANGTHEVTVRDAWTHDVLNNSTLVVNGTDRSLTYTVDQFADLDLSSATGLTVVRDLESVQERSVGYDVNVRLNVLNATTSDTIITETLPQHYTLNETYGVQYDGTGTVNWTYNQSTRVLKLTVSGDVEDIRYRALPTSDAGNAIEFAGTYHENGSTNTEQIIGQSTIYGEQYMLTGTVYKADGAPANESAAAVVSTESSFANATFTNSTGGFTIEAPAGETVDLQLYQIRSEQTARTISNRDGTADVYAAARLNRTEHTDLGAIQLPVGHVVNVSVVDENGNPVPNATLTLEHTGPNGANASIPGINVDKNGLLHFNNTTEPGVELNGTVRLEIQPPSGYTATDTVKTRTINHSTSVDFVLNRTDETSDGSGDSGTANISIVSTAASTTTTTVGEEVTLSATLENTGSVSGETIVTFYQNGSLLEETSVNVSANSVKNVSVTRTFSEPGTYNMTVSLDSRTSVTDIATITVKPTLRVANATLSNTTITAGSTAVINATVVNDGASADTLNVTLYVDGNAVAQRPVTVNASSTKTVTFERPFDEPGTYNVSVNNVSLTPLKVQEDTTSMSAPGFGFGAALAALLAVVLLRRRE